MQPPFTLPFETFWSWLMGHPNCILRVGTPEVVLYDDEHLHWHFATYEESTLVVQLLYGKRAMGEVFIDPDGIGAPCVKPANVGNADVSGIELEAEWFITDDFFIDGSLSTLDFQYTSVDAAALTGSVIAPLDMITPYTPELQWALGLQYGVDLTSGGRFNFRVDASYQDEVYGSATNDSFNLIDDYTLTNAKVWWESSDRDWEIAIQVLNLTDELYYHTIFDQHLSVGQVQAQPAMPRTWVTSATKRF